jgi:hypothetical protein
MKRSSRSYRASDQVAGQVHLAHAATAEQADELVLPDGVAWSQPDGFGWAEKARFAPMMSHMTLLIDRSARSARSAALPVTPVAASVRGTPAGTCG